MLDDATAEASTGPLYRQVESLLRGQIASGHYPVGTVLPTELDLSSSLRVSRATVRSAIRALTEDGIVKPRAGIGTIVVRASGEVRTSRLRGLTEDLGQKGVPTRARVLTAGFETPSEGIRAALGLYRDERVLHLVRLREVAGTPLALIHSFLPESLGLTPEDDFTGLLYDLLERTRRLHITYGRDKVGARAASAEEAAHLQIAAGTPILGIRRTSYAEHDRAVEHAEAAIRGDLYEYDVTLSR